MVQFRLIDGVFSYGGNFRCPKTKECRKKNRTSDEEEESAFRIKDYSIVLV